jgi:hypothetical protein
MDVLEHAFMRDHEAPEKPRHLEAFLRNGDWRVVDCPLLEQRAIRPGAAAWERAVRAQEAVAAVE